MRTEIEVIAKSRGIPKVKKLSRVEAILEQGEMFLWAGQPVAKHFFQRSPIQWFSLGMILVGLTLAAVTAYLYTQTNEAGLNIIIMLVVDLFVAVTLWLKLNEAYFVTNRRVFIMGGNLLKPLYVYTQQHFDRKNLEVVYSGNGYGDLIFVEEIDLEGVQFRTGFNCIAEPEAVALLLRQVFQIV